MQKISVKSFGPIKEIEIKLKDILILNGKQSSGKSTIAKTIYLFKTLPDLLLKALITDENFCDDFEKKIVIVFRKQLLSMFGTTKHFDDFHIKYEYSSNIYINVTKDYNSGHAFVKYSKDLKDGIFKIALKVRKFLEDTKKQESKDYFIYYASKLQFFDSIKYEINNLFNENHECLFLPAGRSLVSTLSGELKNIESYNFDYLMKDFVEKIVIKREIFSKNIDEIVEDKKKLTTTPIDFEAVELAKTLAKEILQADYKYENGEEKLFIDNEHYVKMKFSSSGQQESLWIVNLLLLNILDNKSSFIVYEEPEAHLYPLTQYHMVKLIALSLFSNNNQAIITTHSPYIMAAINTLLLAGNVGKSVSNVKNVINKRFWLDYDRVIAYYVDDGLIVDILDKESKIIDPHHLDSASDNINEDFDNLIRLESQ